jgi:hypothetical protein
VYESIGSNLDPSKSLDPDPHKMNADPKHCFGLDELTPATGYCLVDAANIIFLYMKIKNRIISIIKNACSTLPLQAWQAIRYGVKLVS